ncbi:MAG TPA: hypothetical protein VLW50_06240 [Streptosporangiaceae bacterium]|nr:hypothetical protein [Streptosporangiaceae bacterium]
MAATEIIAPRGQVRTPEEIDRGFADGTLFERSAYRLELLDWYTTPATEQRLARFLAGEQVTAAERAAWLSTIRAARAAGKTMARVHVIAEPLTDYIRFELACYDSSVTAGEDIRILPADLAGGVDLPSCDYWLFDDIRAAVMYYGDRGAWLHSEFVTDPAFVAACRSWRDAALSRAIPLNAYLARSTAA